MDYSTRFFLVYFLHPGSMALTLDERIDVWVTVNKLPPRERVFLKLINEGYTVVEAGKLLQVVQPIKHIQYLAKKLSRIANGGVSC